MPLVWSAGYALSNAVDDAFSRITGMEQARDAVGRISEVSVAEVPSPFRYGWLPGSDLQQSLSMPNGVTRQTAYDPHRDVLASITHTNAAGTVLTRRTFAYDAAGRLTARTQYRLGDETNRPDAFGYNLRSELTSAALGTNDYAYAFDPIGNRTTASELSASSVYRVNALNQYTNITSQSYSLQPDNFAPVFDLDGNQTLLKTTTGIWHVTYNAENRPVVFSNDTAVVDMDYDYMGRRFDYKETVNGVVARHERYLYRDYLQIAALDLLNAQPRLRYTLVWDPTEPIATRPLLLSTPFGWHTYGFDQVKNVTELFNVSSGISATYDYAPFGALIHFSGSAISLNSILFSSEINDFALGLVCYNWRHLSPLDGRWSRYDNIDEYEVGASRMNDKRPFANLYVFIYNRVMVNVDILGQTIRAEPDPKKTPPITGDDVYKCSSEQMSMLESAVANICSGINSCPCDATKDPMSKRAQQYIKNVCEQNKGSLVKDFVVGCAKDTEKDCNGGWGFYPPGSRRAIICEKTFKNRPGGVQCTLIHELGHVGSGGQGGEKPATDMTKCLNCPPP